MFSPRLSWREEPSGVTADSHLIDEFCHVLCAVILQPREVEQLRYLPHLHHVVLTHRLSQRLPADALESRQQIHVGNAQHVKHVVCSELGIAKKIQ